MVTGFRSFSRMQIVHLAIFLFNNKCELFYLYVVLNKRKKDLGLGGSENPGEH